LVSSKSINIHGRVRDMITTLEAYGVDVQPDDWNKFKGNLELQAGMLVA
jgi:hypothetical protein